MNAPAVFYVPHPDDEAIGMAGMIRKMKAEGVPVYLVLLTDGYNKKVLDLLNGVLYCRWHRTYHRFNLSMDQLMRARKVEFIASAQRLEAEEVFILNDGRGIADLLAPSAMPYDNFVEEIQRIVKEFSARFPQCTSHFTSGSNDSFGQSPERPEGSTQPTHVACWKAAMSLRNELTSVFFHRIYIYARPKPERKADQHLELTSAWLEAKQAALAEYRAYQPELGRYGVGYHSARHIIDAAANDDVEYMDAVR